MSILARLRARCPGPGGEYQLSGDDLDALLRLAEAAARVDAAVDTFHSTGTLEAREQVALAELAYNGAARVLRGRS